MSEEIRNGVAHDGTSFDLIGEANKPVVVLIHGLGLCRHIWDAHLPSLCEHYRVLNYDLYGHGGSAPPRRTASLSVFSDQLAGLMDYLSIKKASVIGFSIGGMINRRFALDHADMLSALVILNSPHDRGDEAQELVEARAAKVREQGAMATLDDALKRWFTPAYLSDGAGVGKVREWRKNVDPESYAQSAWVLANGVRELIDTTATISAPTLVMTCENDTGSTPNMSYAISAEIDNSETIIVPRLQHLGLIEEPDRFTQPILEFLERKLT